MHAILGRSLKKRHSARERENVVGKKVTEVLPGVQNDPAGWISIYGRVALGGESVQFENYLESLKKWYHVSNYSPQKGFLSRFSRTSLNVKKLKKHLEKVSSG